MKREVSVESSFERNGITVKVTETKTVVSNSEDEVKRIKIDMILKNLEAVSEAIT